MGGVFDALYTRLLLRDVLGKTVPGAVLLVSLYLTFLSEASDLRSGLNSVTMAPWTFWLATGLLGWVTAFAIQAMGGWLPEKRYLPYIRYSVDPIADALEFHRKLLTFARLASDSEKQIFERFVVVKEASGNSSLSAFLSGVGFHRHGTPPVQNLSPRSLT